MSNKKIVSLAYMFNVGCVFLTAVQIVLHARVFSWIDSKISSWTEFISPYYSLAHPVRTHFFVGTVIGILSLLEVFIVYRIFKAVIANPENNKDSVRLFFGIKAVITIVLAILGIVIAGFHM